MMGVMRKTTEWVELLVSCPIEMAARNPGIISVRISVEMGFGVLHRRGREWVGDYWIGNVLELNRRGE